MIWWLGQSLAVQKTILSHLCPLSSFIRRPNICLPSPSLWLRIRWLFLTFAKACLFSCKMPYFQSCPPGISFYVFTPSYPFSLTGFLPFGRLKRAPDISNLITRAEVLDCGRSRARAHIICCSVMQGSCFWGVMLPVQAQLRGHSCG